MLSPHLEEPDFPSFATVERLPFGECLQPQSRLLELKLDCRQRLFVEHLVGCGIEGLFEEVLELQWIVGVFGVAVRPAI